MHRRCKCALFRVRMERPLSNLSSSEFDFSSDWILAEILRIPPPFSRLLLLRGFLCANVIGEAAGQTSLCAWIDCCLAFEARASVTNGGRVWHQTYSGTPFSPGCFGESGVNQFHRRARGSIDHKSMDQKPNKWHECGVHMRIPRGVI